jgi:hypothetical protein
MPDLAMYQCEWQPSPRDEKLAALAARYCADTEAYDRTVCSGPVVAGEIYPATDRELSLISRHAKRLRQQILEEARAAGFTQAELNRAIALHDRRRPDA